MTDTDKDRQIADDIAIVSRLALTPAPEAPHADARALCATPTCDAPAQPNDRYCGPCRARYDDIRYST